MKIAWNEIKYQPKKFILIELPHYHPHVYGGVLIRADKWTGPFGISPNR